MTKELSTGRSISMVLEEYEAKRDTAEQSVQRFEDAKSALEASASIGGTYVGPVIRQGYAHASDVRRNLLKSAWKNVYDGLNIARISSATDRKRFEAALESPPEFTADNIRATFGDYLRNPRENVLRGLAEVFCSLDPAYKSHSKVKIGVSKLPKRVIISNVGGFGSFGKDRLTDILNAYRAYQGEPLVEYRDIVEFIDIAKRDKADGLLVNPFPGFTLKLFANGNGHLHFSSEVCRTINLALAAYYGEVLPDVQPEDLKPCASTALSKDLQYYPTPDHVAVRVLGDICFRDGQRVLEPSCGRGELLNHIPRRCEVFGIEVHPSRAADARAIGHNVLTTNFLEYPAPRSESEAFDFVVMNPPFYGRHYLKHINHALKFLNPGGKLIAILPATAWYDHGELPPGGRWEDLPVGSFAESGTRVPTGVWRFAA